ncbi:hypothetical protein E2C01_040829 [Portunus trituberculatus]|uniref:Uncharacterized protein n=1 Tax=Portunus trituberculatus TaxID=210409 RepID=A0A5B7FRU4_PORTR|nr:hypothetical protein [Portunus trituberculatus]
MRSHKGWDAGDGESEGEIATGCLNLLDDELSSGDVLSIAVNLKYPCSLDWFVLRGWKRRVAHN